MFAESADGRVSARQETGQPASRGQPPDRRHGPGEAAYDTVPSAAEVSNFAGLRDGPRHQVLDQHEQEGAVLQKFRRIGETAVGQAQLFAGAVIGARRSTV